MIAQAQPDDQNTSLIRPPKKLPVPPETQPIPGSVPPAGAGSIMPLPPPTVTDGGISQLPFGNGVSPIAPVSQGDPAENTNLGSTLIAPVPGAAPISQSAESWRQKFGSELTPTDISAGAITDPRVGAYNSKLDTAVDALGNTDRRSMLSSLLSDFDQQSAEGEDRATTNIGRRASALGRLGMGNTAQDIDQVGRQAKADRQRFRNSLAQDTIGQEISDRFSKAGLLGNLSDSVYGRAAGDRSFNYGVNRDNQNARTAAQEMAYRFGNDRALTDYNQAADARNEYRGERAYQDSRDAYSTDRAIQQAQLGDDLTNSAFRRSGTQYELGRQGNPASTYLGASGDLQDQSSSTMQALMQYLQSLGIGAGSQ